MQRVLVTGGAGFIGSSFVRLLIFKGYCVPVLGNLSYAERKKNLEEKC
ncbi:MAG: NAD-dependent epimerase/dehydratase family protein [Candidatus Kaelpia imicola]|nr:NAD-dependent epimerase/dehydratase family protein [Candidatus Kaelpia imicola]